MQHDLTPLLGRTLSEGKTKRIIEKLDDASRVILLAKDDITAGDGAKHDIIPDKGKLATQTACNVFRLLKDCGMPVAFDEQGGPDWFVAPACQMLPYEVVTRREAHGSFLKRAPQLKKGHLFPKLVVEFFLKTSTN
jgi:phosphoribosylaminoimidazole-succinocarboxamide synthase